MPHISSDVGLGILDFNLIYFHQATLVGFTTDEVEKRVLYQYLAEASEKFPKVFPVVSNLLDSKVNEHLRYR